MIYRSFKFKLKETPEQAALFEKCAGVCRLVYNAALEQRRDYWRQYRAVRGKNISANGQALELTALRREFDWVAAVPLICQSCALDDVDQAYKNFFAGTAGYPTPRRKGVNDSFRFTYDTVRLRTCRNTRWAEIRLPKIGWVRYRVTRELQGKLKTVTVKREALGWHVIFVCAIEHEAPANMLPAVGIDRGVAVPVMLSTGEQHHLPQSIAKLGKRKRRAQRALSRRKRGSKRYARARQRVAALAAKQARTRAHWQHELAASIVARFGTVVLEKLKTKNMTRSAAGTLDQPGVNVSQKRGLNRSILNVGWYGIEQKLAYKLDASGGQLVYVNPAHTSQECSACHNISPLSRKSQTVFECVECGERLNADLNAARNIKRRWNTPLLGVEACHWAACEALTEFAA